MASLQDLLIMPYLSQRLLKGNAFAAPARGEKHGASSGSWIGGEFRTGAPQGFPPPKTARAHWQALRGGVPRPPLSSPGSSVIEQPGQELTTPREGCRPLLEGLT